MEIPCCFSCFSDLQSSGMTFQRQQSSIQSQGSHACSWRLSKASLRGQALLQGLYERSERWGGAQWLLERPHRQPPLPGTSLPFEILPLAFTLRLPIPSYLLDQCQLLLVFVWSLHQQSLCRALADYPNAQGVWLPRVLGKNISSAFSNFLYTICSLLSFQISLFATPTMAPKQNLDLQPKHSINTILIDFVKKGLKGSSLAQLSCQTCLMSVHEVFHQNISTFTLSKWMFFVAGTHKVWTSIPISLP